MGRGWLGQVPRRLRYRPPARRAAPPAAPELLEVARRDRPVRGPREDAITRGLRQWAEWTERDGAE